MVLSCVGDEGQNLKNFSRQDAKPQRRAEPKSKFFGFDLNPELKLLILTLSVLCVLARECS